MEPPVVRRGGTARAVAVGLLAGGVAALVVAQFLSTAPARVDGLPVWVRTAAGLTAAAGVGALVVPTWRARWESPWTDGRRWTIAFGLGGVLVGMWAVTACAADIGSGLPGPATPLLAVGCVAAIVAAVLLVLTAPGTAQRGSLSAKHFRSPWHSSWSRRWPWPWRWRPS